MLFEERAWQCEQLNTGTLRQNEAMAGELSDQGRLTCESES